MKHVVSIAARLRRLSCCNHEKRVTRLILLNDVSTSGVGVAEVCVCVCVVVVTGDEYRTRLSEKFEASKCDQQKNRQKNRA